jgi:CMP-N-acetylneuraminic acid synthetase
MNQKNLKKILRYPVAIISARGNSKRLKNKNILNIFGKPMIYWTIKAIKKSKYVKDFYVSSESEKILNVSKKYNVKTIKRNKKLSKFNVVKLDVVKDAIRKISKKRKPSLIVSLQGNSPEIKSFHIDKLIKHLIKYNLNEVVSVDNNFNQDAAIRVMKYNALFSKNLSTHLGFVVTNLKDIHYKKDLNSLKKNAFK